MSEHTTEQSTQEIPYGYCQCGCGQLAPISTFNNATRGYVKGEPCRYICGHHQRGRHLVMPSRPLEERFWEKVDRRGPDECWEWQANRTKSGYGAFQIGNRPHRASRVAYELTYGPIPEDMSVCHSCDNRACCNPAHLWIGTNKDNMMDMHAKGRANRPNGEKHHKAKFTNAQVREMRAQFFSGNYTYKEFGQMHDIDRVSMKNILTGVTYKNA